MNPLSLAVETLGDLCHSRNPAEIRLQAAHSLLALADRYEIEDDPDDPGEYAGEYDPTDSESAEIIEFPQGERLTPEEALARHQAFAAQEQESRDTPPETSGGSSFGSGPQRPA